MSDPQERKIDVVCHVLCSCGATHSYEEWQQCPMALVPQVTKPWWREKPLLAVYLEEN